MEWEPGPHGAPHFDGAGAVMRCVSGDFSFDTKNGPLTVYYYCIQIDNKLNKIETEEIGSEPGPERSHIKIFTRSRSGIKLMRFPFTGAIALKMY
jgi:hypothetical protein